MSCRAEAPIQLSHLQICGSENKLHDANGDVSTRPALWTPVDYNIPGRIEPEDHTTWSGRLHAPSIHGHAFFTQCTCAACCRTMLAYTVAFFKPTLIKDSV